LKLKSILVGELYLIKKLNHPVYIFRNGAFYPIIEEGSIPTRDQIHALLENNFKEVFVFQEEALSVKENLQKALTKVTRSLSVGDPLVNGTKDLKLLTLNLGNLYRNPHEDEALTLQFQSTQNLSKFLLEHKRYQSQLFANLSKEKFHFTLTQPLLSSLLLLSFLQTTHLFHEKEIENLFVTSYLKDFGFAMIPEEKYDLKSLSSQEQKLFSDHADFSFELLQGRVPLSKNNLTIVKHHHFLNDKLKNLISDSHEVKEGPEIIFGLESTLVAVFDILVAMTTERPYRRSVGLYHSLELIKKMMSDDYPQEFRALVIFLKQFYKI
jgi:HD-GYP domain-containing protein (c-di-GMP phosphodiesterase class II)